MEKIKELWTKFSKWWDGIWAKITFSESDASDKNENKDENKKKP